MLVKTPQRVMVRQRSMSIDKLYTFLLLFRHGYTRPLVKVVSNLVFGILVRLHICSPLGFGTTMQNDLENPQMSGMILPMSQPASLRAEAERRR